MDPLDDQHDHYDAAIVGAGFGGLGAALRLAELGQRVHLCERLRYPGGCASTFARGGYQFEAGATLFSGFGDGQLFRRWIDDHHLGVEIEWLDPILELRTPDLRVAVPRDRRGLIDRLLALPGAPRDRIESFFRYQRRVADALWPLLDDPGRLPPCGPAAIRWHLRRSPRYLSVLRHASRPLVSVLERFGLSGFAPLRTYLDGLCQITLQCGVHEAEAPFALAAMDYYFRGTGHVVGGIGALAWGLVRAIERLGGTVSFADGARRVTRAGSRLRLETRRSTITADRIVLNVLPHAAADLVDLSVRERERLDRRRREVERGWGACMLYRVVRPVGGDDAPAAHHLELIADPTRPFIEGNHVFCSLSSARDQGRAPDGLRTLTASTHVPGTDEETWTGRDRAAYIALVQQRMSDTLQSLAPEWTAEIHHGMTASPRTFERFTGRYRGLVGGVPRRAGIRQYLDLAPIEVTPGVHLVGDSVFPGQSTLAAAIGGAKCADRLAR